MIVQQIMFGYQGGTGIAEMTAGREKTPRHGDCFQSGNLCSLAQIFTIGQSNMAMENHPQKEVFFTG